MNKWLVCAAVFFLLSPGVLLTIPAGSKGLLFSRQTSIAAAAVHALVFVWVMSWLRGAYPGLLEGFEDGTVSEPGCPPGQVRVSGACRSTCLQGQYNQGSKGCY
jgi:hypothetical protein